MSLSALAAGVPAAATAQPLSWSAPVNIDPGHAVVGVSCPTSAFCAAVDIAGNVLVSHNPTGGAGAWTLERGVEPPEGIAISCASESLCVVVGHANVISVSTNPLGGTRTWKTAALSDPGPAASFTGVACPTTTLCVIADSESFQLIRGYILASTDPAGGPSAWTPRDVQPFQTNPLLQALVVPAIPYDVSCASAHLCVASDVEGRVLRASDPAGPGTGWRSSYLDSGPMIRFKGGFYAPKLTAVGCGRPATCMVLDEYRRSPVWTTTVPYFGRLGWHPSTIAGTGDFAGGTTGAVACPSSTMCVAGDALGNVVETTDPGAGDPTWSLQAIDPNQLAAFSCPTTTLCVGVDSIGDVLTGT
jgi:hypothetical protein